MAKAEDGLWYQCQRCTNCCQWEGDVVLEEGEVEVIADYLGIPLYEFVKDYTRLRENRLGLSLIDKSGDYRVYHARWKKLPSSGGQTGAVCRFPPTDGIFLAGGRCARPFPLFVSPKSNSYFSKLSFSSLGVMTARQ